MARTFERSAYGGLRTVTLESAAMSVDVLPDKGADIVAVRPRDGPNILFESPHNWQPLDGHYRPSQYEGPTWMDHYPGGWQDCLPLAGVEGSAHGAKYGLHGETPLIGWTVDLPQQPDEVAELTCSVELVRYPLTVTRHLELDGDGLHVTWELVNDSQCRLPIVWLQHLAFGEPLLGPETRIEIPDCWVTVDDEPQGNSPLDPGEEFAWPTNDHGTDMRVVQPRSAGIHDLSYLHELDAGTYTVRNPDQNLAATVRFDKEIFGCLWCWRAFGGFIESPFFGREYVLGLEPATGWPASNVPQSQGEDGTQSLQYLEPGETLTTWMDLTVFEP